ncbi:hypothetical protein SteCoe_20810 [Stentor coeruleus]|uniref:Uncharacterized protein n=1 Tax=Stentor coeruleus TaxID=5963 RepID=A0A1R2BQV1_9CILI|nr:hypothetical protein SteCoe_20810 [Stentor coeruleus]
MITRNPKVADAINRSQKQIACIDSVLNTSNNTDNSYPSRKASRLLDHSAELEPEDTFYQNKSYERALDELNLKIKILENKAIEDQKVIETLRSKVKASQANDKLMISKLEYENTQADKVIRNLKETLAIGLEEENRMLKQEFERLLRIGGFEENKEHKERDQIIQDKKINGTQYNGF